MNRYWKSFINAAFMTVAFVGILCLLYYVADRRHYRYDMTKNKQFSLTVQTEKVLGGLDGGITATAFFIEGDGTGEMVKDLLKEYRFAGKGKFRFNFIDPEKNPAAAKKYGITAERVVVFEAGRRRKDVVESEMFIQSFDPYAQAPPEFIAEESFTNAMVNITGRGDVTVCFIEGHGERRSADTERGGFSEAAAAIEKDNYKVQTIDLPVEHEIPGGCAVIVIASPRAALHEKELLEVNRRLDAGGAALLLLDPENTAGLDKLMSKWNIAAGADVVVDKGSMFYYGPLTPIPAYGAHEITEELQKGGMASIFPATRSLREAGGAKDVEVTPLLMSSDDSWAEIDLEDPDVKFGEGDTKGPVALAMAASRKSGKTESRMVVVGDSDFAANEVIANGANRDFLVNAVNWLAGEADKISIRPRPQDEAKATLTGGVIRFIFLFTVLVLPGALLALGGVIWAARRNL